MKTQITQITQISIEKSTEIIQSREITKFTIMITQLNDENEKQLDWNRWYLK